MSQKTGEHRSSNHCAKSAHNNRKAAHSPFYFSHFHCFGSSYCMSCGSDRQPPGNCMANTEKLTFVCLPEVILFSGACTGFDGGFEVGEAIRRLLDCVPTRNLNINANEQYALAA